MKPLIMLVALMGCFRASTPCPPSAPTSAIANIEADEPRSEMHLSRTSRIPLVNREARIVAGYYDEVRAGKTRLRFKAKLANNDIVADDLFLTGEDRPDPLHLEASVNSWLAGGTWHPMEVGTRNIGSERQGKVIDIWEFPMLHIAALITAASPPAVIFHHDNTKGGRLLGSSPTDRSAKFTSTEPRVNQLAFDPVSGLAWLAWGEPDDDVEVFWTPDHQKYEQLFTFPNRPKK